MKKETRGRKPKEDPRILNINIRVNKAEKAKFDDMCDRIKESQADTILFLMDFYCMNWRT